MVAFSLYIHGVVSANSNVRVSTSSWETNCGFSVLEKSRGLFPYRLGYIDVIFRPRWTEK